MNMAIFCQDGDSLADLIRPAAPGEAIRKPTTPPATYQAPHYEPCGKCRGTGQTRWGVCFRCKGKGGKSFKTSAAERMQARAQRIERKAKTAESNLADFAIAYPDLHAWMIEAAPRFGFAASMIEAVRRFGSLTAGQEAAVRKCIAKRDQARAERQDRLENAKTIDIARIAEAFATATKSGLRRPRLFLDAFCFKPAKATGSNPGAIYVTENTEYLGKIVDGKFIRVRACTTDQEARIIAAAANPAEAARSYGKMTGACSCCGRTLTDPDSVAAGIGPICATNFGF